ncbi:MAG TPA: sugar transferase [Dehalococcoidia bacterium]|nr:sugar transferase [Dehalococcoidia bacterium]
MNQTVAQEMHIGGTLVNAADRVLYIPLGPQVGLAAVVKRLLDVALSLLLLLVFSPIIVSISVAILLQDGRPVFFSQKRMGQNGKKFTVYKFRSMHRDAEKLLQQVKQHNNIQDGPIFKWRQDSRITKVGRFLRRTSLDELPQLWNVLLGNMSLVGPRPPLESEVIEYEGWQLRRLAVKPGMTGLWQVSGRSNLGFVQMVGLDIDYIEAWSVWRDLSLLVRTPLAVITARGAY